jgi:FAD/FMN-containing dehydrogenase
MFMRALWLVAAGASAVASLCSSEGYDCLPGQPCWPSVAEWKAFNATVSGHLHATVMLGSPCFPSESNYDNATCANAKAHYFNATFREQTYGATEIVNWEACGPYNCYPSIFAAQGATCSLGRMSAMYVDAQSPADVAATIAFVRAHCIRLVVKNSGHDYLGRSTGPNTLALWMQNMKTYEFHSTFTAQDCPDANAANVGVIGAGVTAHEAVQYFLQHGMSVAVGGCPSIAIAGGFGQGGGHGLLAPSVGLMVDQAIEFDVVTADGVLRTINQCNHPDLFWAMRGGGGGTYAVLTAYKFRLHPTVPLAVYHFRANISAAAITPNITKSTVLHDVITAFASNQTTWSKNNISGYDFFTPKTVEFFEVLPAAGDPMTKLKELTQQVAYFLSNSSDLDIVTNEYILYSDLTELEIDQADLISRQAGSGIGNVLSSRMLTKDLFSSAANISMLVGAILQGMETAVSMVGLEIAALDIPFGAHKTAPVNTPDTARTTSANPVWRQTLVHWITAAGWVPGTNASDIAAMAMAARAGMEKIRDVLPVQAAYTNEADYDEPDWQSVFFGENYDRLLQVKQKYDPTVLLNAWKTVGWLGPKEQLYSCYGSDPHPSLPFNKSLLI